MAALVHVELFNLKGPLAELDVDEGCRVLELKRKVADICGLPPPCQALTVGSRIAGNTEVLRSLRAEPGAALSITVVNTVYQCLQADGPCIDKVAAVEYLGSSAVANDAGVLAALQECLADRHDDVRQAAAAALAKVAAPAAPELGRLLAHADGAVRSAAARALGPLGAEAGPFALELARLLPDEETRVRRAAAHALGELGRHAAPAVVELARLMGNVRGEVREAASGVVAGLGPLAAPSAPVLAELVAHEDWQVRHAAADALVRLGGAASNAAPSLAELLQHDDQKVRHKALSGLAELGRHAHPFVPEMTKLLSDGTSEVRGAAVKALARLAPPAHKPLLLAAFLELLSDASGMVKHEAEEAIHSLLGANDAVQRYRAVLKGLKDGSWQARAQAARGLGELGSELGLQPGLLLPEFKALINDSNPKVRLEVLSTLCGFGKQAAPLAPHASELLGDSNTGVRHEALQLFAGLGEQAAPHTAAVAKLLADGHWEVCLQALTVLGRLGQHAVPFKAQVMTLKAHSEPSVREEAAKVLAGLKNCKAISTAKTNGAATVQELDLRSQAQALVTRAAPKTPTPKQRQLIPIDEAERMLEGIATIRSTPLDKMKQLQDIAKLAVAPARLKTVVAVCDAFHACAWARELPAEYRAEECLAVDCDACGARDLQARAATTPFCHCSFCSFDICARCAVDRAGRELGRMLREEREHR